MRPLLSLLALFVLISHPVLAAETAWQEVSPDVRLRLVSTGVVKPDGTTLVGLEIDMPPTTKTYWRVPGETGFPAELDFSQSTGVTEARLLWPHPRHEEGDGYLDYAYFGPTLLPLSVETSDPDATLDLSVMLGVCSDICVPAQASFQLDLVDEKPDRANGIRIKQAEAMTPLPWTEGPEPIGAVDYRPESQSIGVWLNDPGLDLQSLIAATESGEPLFGAPQKSPQDGLVLLPILSKTENSAVEGQEVQLTFMTDRGAFELRRHISAEQKSN